MTWNEISRWKYFGDGRGWGARGAGRVAQEVSTEPLREPYFQEPTIWNFLFPMMRCGFREDTRLKRPISKL